MTALRVGTRRSALARAQATIVADALTRASGVEVELVGITTYGDTTPEALDVIGGTGVFVGALREALLRGEVDLTVHSAKDLPTADADGLVLAALPERTDPRDVLVASRGRTLAELGGARVGTGSPRRSAQLHALGLDLDVVPVRGNVDTRLRKVADGELDAVVLARAGLLRLGRDAEATEVLDPLTMLPAPAQGALAVECRADDARAREVARAIEDPVARATVSCERALLRTLESGCAAPVGALAEVAEGDSGPELYVRAVVLAPDGLDAVRLSATGAVGEAESVGMSLAESLLAEGAADLIKERVP